MKKFRRFIKEHKKIVIGTGSFVILGLLGLLLGFEISQDWHAIRNWLNSDSAVTFFIIAIVGLFVLAIVVFSFISMKMGENE